MTPHDILRRILCPHGAPGTHGAHDHAVLTGRHAAWYDAIATRWVLRPLYRTVAGQVADAVPRGGNVLDVGTGPGRLLIEIAHRRPDVRLVGIDPSLDMVRLAQHNARTAGLTARMSVCAAGAEALPFGSDAFDVVVSSLSGHHWVDLAGGIAEQARVLRPAGTLWAYDLRGASSQALADALERNFAAVASAPVLSGGILGIAMTRHRASGPVDRSAVS